MYTLEGRVRYSECDSNSNLTLTALMNYLQDCSCFHTESVGHGLAFLAEKHFAWFIASWQIEIDHLPRYCDEISVSTWCYGVKRTQAGRNFTIAAADGSACVRADSQWFVFDTEARRPIRIPAGEDVYLDENTPRLETPIVGRRIELGEHAVEAAPIRVGIEHLDSNEHVNNARYVTMAFDAAAEVTGMQRSLSVPASISVQYRQMALLGDSIVPRVYVDSASVTVDLASPDGMTYALVRFA